MAKHTYRGLCRLMVSAAVIALCAPAMAQGVQKAAGYSYADVLDQPPVDSSISVQPSTPQELVKAGDVSLPQTASVPLSPRVTGRRPTEPEPTAAIAAPISAPEAEVTAMTPLRTQAVEAVPGPDGIVPLSLSSMVMFALADNPDIRMALAREDAADANIGKARSKYFPLIDLVAEGGRAFDRPSSGVESGNGNSVYTRRASLSGTQMLYDFDKTSLAVGQQAQLKESAKLDTQVNVEETMNRTLEAYMQMLQFQSSLKTSTEFVARMRELNDTIVQTYEAGASSKTTLDYANSRMASAETDLNTLKANIVDTKSNLEFLTGPLPEFTAMAPDDLDPARLDIKKYLELAESKNTGIQLSNSDLVALKTKMDIAKSAYYPSVNFVFSADDKFNDGGRTKAQDQVKALVQMSYRLYDGGARKNDVRLARAQVHESEINQEKILKELRLQIRQSYNQVVSIQDSRKQTLKEIASSDALQQLNRENFRMGSINVIELIEGEERLNAAHAKLHQLNSDLYLNVYRLLITSGFMKQNFFCDSCAQPAMVQASK